eukprot:TRINITY_DN8112_c0_g3_i1.p1 TRINITY_DN8112_c0_g3~~TRINITY_DN8112_c0_g3_i1.p1  ORF type:complete len:4071 (+),score=984.48 TRINITY_DN8112_c0_g3_i1:367-12213(+)
MSGQDASGGSGAGSEAGAAELRQGASRPPKSFLEALGLQEKPSVELMREQLTVMETWASGLSGEEFDAHTTWLTRCMYDQLYPVVFVTPPGHDALDAEVQKQKAKELQAATRIWVPRAGFIPLSRVARQTIEFSPYLVRAPGELREKVPWLWTNTKDSFTIPDCSEALQLIQADLEKQAAAVAAKKTKEDAEDTEAADDAAEKEEKTVVPVLSLEQLEIAVRLVMAITDMAQKERASGLATSTDDKILMPTSDCTLRPVEECVFNNMTWLPDVETSEVSLGNFCLVHSKISHTVAHTCGCRGLSLVYARDATEMAGADWFEAAGQSEPMTTRLKNLLKDYPADISMFKEMVQNADDAGATKVHFIWDWREHRKQSLLTPDMDRWQGPCLWVYNDSTFSSKDFESICRLGVGGKRSASAKIGRFGLGFNSVYNFTDVPSILSDDVVLFLDPHVRHLQAMGASVQKPGIKLRFLKIDVLDKFRDQFEPYHNLMGCDLRSSRPFNGTLIRVPFRTGEGARASEICNIMVDHATADALRSQFEAEAHQWLLFLRNVSSVELSEISEDGGSSPQVRRLAHVELERPGKASEQSTSQGSEAVVTKREPRISAMAVGADGQPILANISIRSMTSGASPSPSPVSNGGEAGELHRYRLIGGQASRTEDKVCVALPLRRTEQQDDGNAGDGEQSAPLALGREEGRLFCFLPLPRSAVSLRSPAHVHAPLNTTQDRRSVVLDDRVGDRELIKHNIHLLDISIPELLARSVLDMSTKVSPKDLYHLFPTLTASGDGEQGASGSGVADRVAHAFYKLLVKGTQPLLPVSLPGVSQDAVAAMCVAYREAVFFSQREGMGANNVDNRGLLSLVGATLARFGVPVVEVPVRVLESIERVLHPAQPRVLTPAWLRQFMRSMGNMAVASGKKNPSFALKASDAVPEKPSKPKNGQVQVDYLTEEEAFAMLDFALSDNDYADLEGVPLLVTCDLSEGTLAFSSENKAASIFVPEDDEEYLLLPHAPHRAVAKGLRVQRSRVWQHLRHIASDESGSGAEDAKAGKTQPRRPPPPGAAPEQPSPPAYQLRRMALKPLTTALLDLLPQSWNSAVAEIAWAEWEDWVEKWLQAMWRWLARQSLPATHFMHWPLLPSVKLKEEATPEESSAAAGKEEQEEAAEESKPANETAEAKPKTPTPPGTVHLHKLVPDSLLFSAWDANEGGKTAATQSQTAAGAPPLHGFVREALVKVLQSNLGCTPIWEPAWLRQRHGQDIKGFIHACTADGYLQAAHARLRQMLPPVPATAQRGPPPPGQQGVPVGGAAETAKKMEEYNQKRLRVLRDFRNLVGKNVSDEETSALAAWLGLARQEGCSCQGLADVAWKRKCDVVKGAPIFCPFARPGERVALLDYETMKMGETDPRASGGALGSWSLLPEACPEVAATLRAAGVQLATCVEVPPAPAGLAGQSSEALLRELQLPRLSWAELLVSYVFPWVAGAAETQARQGVMMAIVSRWKEMELAGNDRCVEALQTVPFVSTVGGRVLPPCEILDPTVEELRQLYLQEDGPFPTADTFSLLSPAAQRGLLRFRKEISAQELTERLTYLHKQSSSGGVTEEIGEEFQIEITKVETSKIGVTAGRDRNGLLKLTAIEDGLIRAWNESNPEKQVLPGDIFLKVNAQDKLDEMAGELKKNQEMTITVGRHKKLNWLPVKSVAESLLRYVAERVAGRCAAPAAGAAVPDANLGLAGNSAASLAAQVQRSSVAAAGSFFLWSSSLRTAISGESEDPGNTQEPWTEEEIEVVRVKLQSCSWLPAAAPPKDWPSALPWKGHESSLHRADALWPMTEALTCGSVKPMLCLDTQLALPADRRGHVHRCLVQLLQTRTPEYMDKLALAWEQLDVVRTWWGTLAKPSPPDIVWAATCLYRNVYPTLDSPLPPPAEDAPGEQRWSSERTLEDMLINGSFVKLEDVSLEQEFGDAELVQVPGELRKLAAVQRVVKRCFTAEDCARALQRLRDKLAAEDRKLKASESQVAVRLAIALADCVKHNGEGLPEPVTVPTNKATLRLAHECVFNNMKWLSQEEQHRRAAGIESCGLDWIHASISNEVAQTLRVRGLNAQVAAEAMVSAGAEDGPSWFEAAGQAEPLTSRIHTLLRDINDGGSGSQTDLGLVKALLQNADDAQATEVHFVWDWRSFGSQSLMSPEMAHLQGPCLWAHNDASFSQQDFENITQLGSMQRTKHASGGSGGSRVAQIGRFGLGFNSVYTYTDLPSILSDDVVLFLDPHVKHLRAMGASAHKPGIKLKFLKIDVLDKFKDQFEPYHGLFGCDLRSSDPYKGTLMRMPFRTPESAKKSEICNFVATPATALETIAAFRGAAAQCLLFLQNVKKIRFSWIPADAPAGAVPAPICEAVIVPPSPIPGANSEDVSEADDIGAGVQDSMEPWVAKLATTARITTDRCALEYRRVFASRTLPQSREHRSFIATMLGQMGLPAQLIYAPQETERQEPQPFAAFNMAIAVRLLQVPGPSPARIQPTERLDSWRLFLWHDNAEDADWNDHGDMETDSTATGTTAAETETTEGAGAPATKGQSTASDFIPFAGIAVCLSRKLSQVEPRLSCFLPLPLQSALPFLINANFMMCDPMNASRLDLVTSSGQGQGQTARAAAWNQKLLRKLVQPMLRACIEEQASLLLKVSKQGTAAPPSPDAAPLPLADWLMESGGVCALMPSMSQLPNSLKELLDLKMMYVDMSGRRLFMPWSRQAEGGRQPALQDSDSLLAFTASVQPLIEAPLTEAQRDAVHDYVQEAGPFTLSYVDKTISAEFLAAEARRKAVICAQMLVEQLTRKKPKNAEVALGILGYLLSGTSQSAEASAGTPPPSAAAAPQGGGEDTARLLGGLPLAPLCDGAVGSFFRQGQEETGSLYCSFDGAVSVSTPNAQFAQHVLERVCARHTLCLRGLKPEATELLRRAAPSLGVTEVNRCKHLAKALREALPSLVDGHSETAATVVSAAAAATPVLGDLARTVVGAASTLVDTVMGSRSSGFASANALGLGTDADAHDIIKGIWEFAKTSEDGLGDEFLSSFKSFQIVPACDAEQECARMQQGMAADEQARPPPPPPPPIPAAATTPGMEPGSFVSGGSSSSTSGPGRPATQQLPAWPLHLMSLGSHRPFMLLPRAEDRDALALLEVVAKLLPDHFADARHPALSSEALRFLADKGLARRFGNSAVLAVLAAAHSSVSAGLLVSTPMTNAGRLTAAQRRLLRRELSTALLAAAAAQRAEEDGAPDRLAACVEVFCSLPLFQSHNNLAAGDAASTDAGTFQALTEFMIVDGAPLQLAAPPPRLDVGSTYIFKASQDLEATLANVLSLDVVKQYLDGRGRRIPHSDWLIRYVIPHMADMTPEDQVVVLESLLPQLDPEQANNHPGLVPAEVAGGGSLLKPPQRLLDPADYAVQLIFGISGESVPALSRSSVFHFPARTLSTTVRTQLRRLGMRQSEHDDDCLLFLLRELRKKHDEYPSERYGELQRTLLQRIVESWHALEVDSRGQLLTEEFVDVSADVDDGEATDTLFALKPYRFQCGKRLMALRELVSRSDNVDPYLCWTSLPLCPRGFPAYAGYRKPTLENVISHAKALGELGDAGKISVHLWQEVRERVVIEICRYLAESEPFCVVLAARPPEAEAGEGQGETPQDTAATAAARARICSQLRRAKFLAVPLEMSGGDDDASGPHTLVAPWRISLVLKEHRPPMFALPSYLHDFVELLKMLGVRDALEMPQGDSAAMNEKEAGQAAGQALGWLFENGAESFSDVTVMCDGGSLYLHRCVLMARSEYYRAMFQGGEFGFREGQEGGTTVHLPEAPVEVARVLFGYLYHGKVDEAPLEGPEGAGYAVELLRLADELGVPQLFEFAQLWIANQQDLEDCSETLKIASLHGAKVLERATLSLLAANMDAPEVQEVLKELSQEHKEALQALAPGRAAVR